MTCDNIIVDDFSSAVYASQFDITVHWPIFIPDVGKFVLIVIWAESRYRGGSEGELTSDFLTASDRQKV